MKCIPPSRFNVKTTTWKKRHTSTILLVPMAFALVTSPAASVGKEMAMMDLSTGSYHRDIRGHGTLPYSHVCCSPWPWWYTISKTSLKYCKGEPVKVLSYLRFPQLLRWVLKLLSPVFLTEGLGLCSLWCVCHLLPMLQLAAALKSTVHWRKAVPSWVWTSVQAETSRRELQISLFKSLPLHSSTSYTIHSHNPSYL